MNSSEKQPDILIDSKFRKYVRQHVGPAAVAAVFLFVSANAGHSEQFEDVIVSDSEITGIYKTKTNPSRIEGCLPQDSVTKPSAVELGLACVDVDVAVSFEA